MTHVVVDDLADPAAWATRAPSGTASTELTAEAGAISRLGGPTLHLRGTEAALDHRAERTLDPVDLTAPEDLSLWVYGDRRADGAEGRPFFLELRLGSAALPIGSGENEWHRLIPVHQARVWEPVPVALDDLPQPVRSAVEHDPHPVRGRHGAVRGRCGGFLAAYAKVSSNMTS